MVGTHRPDWANVCPALIGLYVFEGRVCRRAALKAHKWLKIVSIQRFELITKHLVSNAAALTTDDANNAGLRARA